MTTRAPILVTGAGGFVCSEIAVALVRRGFEVIAVDRHFDAETARRLSGSRQIESDVRCLQPEDIGPLFAVVHGAAITSDPGRLGISRAAHIRANMDLLTTALDIASIAGAERFLFLSSMGVFNPDDGPHSGAFTEATQPTADCTYCAAKRAGELVTASAADTGFSTLSLRLGNIAGPHETVRETRQHLCLIGRMIAEAKATSIITLHTPDALREWAWLPDLSVAVADLVSEWPRLGQRICHAGTPPVISDLQLARLIAKQISGVTIRLTNPPHQKVRPPMASEVQGLFDAVAWAEVPQMLDQLILAEVVS